MMLQRRAFLGGLISALAAPAIVHAGNLMPIKALPKFLTLQDYYDQILMPMYGMSSMMEATKLLQECNEIIAKMTFIPPHLLRLR